MVHDMHCPRHCRVFAVWDGWAGSPVSFGSSISGRGGGIYQLSACCMLFWSEPQGDHLVGARKAQRRLGVQSGPVSAPHRLGLRCGYSDLHVSVAQSDEMPSSHVWTRADLAQRPAHGDTTSSLSMTLC